MQKNDFQRLSQYRIMWVFVFFDLPTETKKQRKAASDFRDKLLKDGFSMFQFSIYMRFCSSRENLQTHWNRVKRNLPAEGHVGMLQITDKQFELMEIFFSQKKAAKEKPNQQLEIF